MSIFSLNETYSTLSQLSSSRTSRKCFTNRAIRSEARAMHGAIGKLTGGPAEGLAFQGIPVL